MEGKEFGEDTPANMFISSKSPQHIIEHDLKNDLKKEMVNIHQSPSNCCFNMKTITPTRSTIGPIYDLNSPDLSWQQHAYVPKQF
jgi:hypothetical protein